MNGINEVAWGNLPESESYEEAGLTETYVDGDVIREADITIDGDPSSPFRTQECLRATVIHEFGHALGIGHLIDGQVMRASSDECPTELNGRDIEALENRYGPNRDGHSLVRHDEAALDELIVRRYETLGRREWRELYALHSPEFRGVCPYETFVQSQEANSERFGLNPQVRRLDRVGSVEELAQPFPDVAYFEYRVIVFRDTGGSTTFNISGALPDRWVRIGDRWYDDTDANTRC